MEGRYSIQEKAMIVVYEYLYYSQSNLSYVKPLKEIVFDVMEVNFDSCDDFFKAIVYEPIKDFDDLKALISENLSSRWTFERLNIVEQAILLMFASMILNHRNEPSICIDMAVTFAKKYCDENSYKFINGVLDNIAKNYEY